MQVCRRENAKLKKINSVSDVPGFLLSQHVVQPDPLKLHTLTEMPPPKSKRLQVILGIMN